MKHTEAEIDTVRQRVIDGERRIFAQLAIRWQQLVTRRKTPKCT
jgi:hypothetical protein